VYVIIKKSYTIIPFNMFLLYINELTGILEGHGIAVKVFAADVKMYLRVVNAIDVKQIKRQLQQHLNLTNDTRWNSTYRQLESIAALDVLCCHRC